MKNTSKLAVVFLTVALLLALTGCDAGIPQEEYDKIVSERDLYKEQVVQYSSDLDKAETVNQDLSDQLANLLNGKNDLQAEFNAYFEKSSEFNRLTEVEKQSAFEVASRQQELDAIKAEVESMESSIVTLNAEITSLTIKKQAFGDELEAIKNKIIEYNELPVQLSNGSYIAGVDFPEGKYDLYAVAGKGTVSYSDPEDYTNYLHERMAVKEGSYYISSYQNARLNRGVVIQISGVTIELREKAK